MSESNKQSAGILVFRRPHEIVEVLLVHPAGPIWGKKDIWSIPKGELDEGEDHLTAAFREFKEEVGSNLERDSELIDLGFIKQKSGKTNFIWALEADLDLSQFHCETFTMEWPPKSGKIQEFPENDRAEWFDLSTAGKKLFSYQHEFIERLAQKLGVEPGDQSHQQTLL